MATGVEERLRSPINFPKEKSGNHHSSSRYDYPKLESLKRADTIINSL